MNRAVCDKEDMSKNVIEELTKVYNSKDPTTHPIRYFDVLVKVFKSMELMTKDELIGAAKVIGPLSEFMSYFHFEQEGVFNQRSLVKTICEISENIEEDIYHLEKEENMKTS
jgi:hypothetical protein